MSRLRDRYGKNKQKIQKEKIRKEKSHPIFFTPYTQI
jgi:hypothetical protein